MQLVIPGKWGSAAGIGRKENPVPVASSSLLLLLLTAYDLYIF